MAASPPVAGRHCGGGNYPRNPLVQVLISAGGTGADLTACTTGISHWSEPLAEPTGGVYWPRSRRREWNPLRCWRCRHAFRLHYGGPCEVFNCGCPAFTRRPDGE